jgi:glycosyltransferase involved in cell wall biosynthesis
VQILNIISVVLLICYSGILLFFIKGWWSLKNGQPLQSEFKTSVSVLVPVRNEEKHIANLLQDLIAQNYPASLFNIIVIDDHSTDQTAAIVRSFNNSNLRLLNLTLEKPINSYKKRPLDIATGKVEKSLQDLDIFDPDYEEKRNLIKEFYYKHFR